MQNEASTSSNMFTESFLQPGNYNIFVSTYNSIYTYVLLVNVYKCKNDKYLKI